MISTSSNASVYDNSNSFIEYDDFDLEHGPGIELLYDIASPSDAVSLSTIHEDIQLLNYTVLLIYVTVFVVFLVKKWR